MDIQILAVAVNKACNHNAAIMPALQIAAMEGDHSAEVISRYQLNRFVSC